MIYIIAKKVIKGFFGNLIYLPILIGMPMFQIFVISAIFKEIDSTTISSSGSNLVEIFIIKELPPISMLQGFSITMVIMFTMLTAIILAVTEISEREDKTITRIFSSPVKKSQYIAGCIIGQFIILVLSSTTLILLTKIFYKVDWGTSLVGLIIMTMALIFVSLAMGMFFSGIFNNSKIASGVMSFIVVVMTFVSGGLTMNSAFGGLSKLTINWWASQGFIRIVEGEALSSLLNPILVLVTLGIVFSMAATMVYRREGING